MNKLFLMAVGAAIAFSFAAINYAASDDLRKVQSGEVELRCVISGESRTIAPNQVAGLLDGVWIFENGHAKNCEVMKRGDL